MKIDRIEVTCADAGWKRHGFVKVTTSDGIAGWGEFSPTFGGAGAAGPSFDRLSEFLGHQVGSIALQELLRAAGDRSWGDQQAFGAVENALLDIRARALGIPVHELLGGALRDRIPFYWAHCGTYRASHADLIGVQPLRDLDDVVRLGREVAERGIRALKTNVLMFADGVARRYKLPAGEPSVQRAEPVAVQALRDQLAALREGVGPEVQIMVDIGAGFAVDGALDLARVAADAGAVWLEVEDMTPDQMLELRRGSRVPLATGERLRRPQAREYLERSATDVLIVDVPFTGLPEAVRQAVVAETFGTLVAPHNCYSPLATMIAATFCAVVPNLQIMELDVDGVSWEDDFVTIVPGIADGSVVLSDQPGWGTAVAESALDAHRFGDRLVIA